MTIGQLIGMLRECEEFLNSTSYGYIEIVDDNFAPGICCADSRSLDIYINSRLSDQDILVIRDHELDAKTIALEKRGFGVVLLYKEAVFTVLDFSVHEDIRSCENAYFDSADMEAFRDEITLHFLNQNKEMKRLPS